jgi:type III pantothenate kinase
VLLVLDVGNTKTAIGVYSEGKWIADWRITTHLDHLADEYYVLLKSLLEDAGLSFQKLSGAALASVVPPLTATFEELIVRVLGKKPVVVGPGVRTGVQIKIDNPREVGADRIANTAAVQKLHGGPAIVIDLGTATTFDVISAAGEYIGGVICPGIGISADALFQRAARLPRVDVRKPPSIIGQTTVTSMQAGLYFGYVSMVDGIVTRIRAELPGGDRAICIATGGMAGVLSNETTTIQRVEPDLTLQGLRLIWERRGG